MEADIDHDRVVLDSDAHVMAIHGPFELRKTSVVATREARFEEWEGALQWAQAVEKASPFARP